MNSIVHSKTSNNAVLHQESYNYDPANNLDWKLVNSVLTSYTYDEIDQLKTENGGGIANFYNYDANGNRTSKNSNTDFESYAYDDADKLLSVTRVTHASTNYTYDACGRPTNIGSRVLNWDYEDRLTSLNGNGTYTQYGYNGVGSRVTKSNANGSRTYKRNGVGVTAPVLSDGVATMVPGISEKSTGVGTNTILTDRLGSMKGMANGGNVTETAEFDAFGKVVAHNLPSVTQKGFASGFGYQEDGESGYKLLGHRYYDPETGRFLSRDPVQHGRNWYAYCDNNPLNSVDPNGLDHFVIIMGQHSNWYDQGEQEIILQQLIRWLDASGHTYEILYETTRDEAVSALKGADSFVYIGHGTEGGGTIAPNTSEDDGWVMDESFMDDVMVARHGLGFDRIWLFACQGDKQAQMMGAYCNRTVSWSGGFNKWKSAIFLQRLGKDKGKGWKRKKVPLPKSFEPKVTKKSPWPWQRAN